MLDKELRELSDEQLAEFCDLTKDRFGSGFAKLLKETIIKSRDLEKMPKDERVEMLKDFNFILNTLTSDFTQKDREDAFESAFKSYLKNKIKEKAKTSDDERLPVTILLDDDDLHIKFPNGKVEVFEDKRLANHLRKNAKIVNGKIKGRVIMTDLGMDIQVLHKESDDDTDEVDDVDGTC